MDQNPNQLTQDPNEGSPKKSRGCLPKILWLVVAFLPSVLYLMTLEHGNVPPSLTVPLMIFNLLCSFVAAFGLMRGTSLDLSIRILLIILFGICFSGLNVFIAMFIGCAAQLGNMH